MNFLHLHHFWVIACEGSLTQAAKHLGVSHSTLSLQLRALEEELGSALFVRQSRGVVLTPFGEQAKTYCDEIFRLSAELKDSLRGGRTTRRVVRFGHAPSIPRELILDALTPLMSGEEPLSIVLTSGAAEQLVGDLVGGTIHGALVDHPPDTAGNDVYAHTVGETRISIYGAEKLTRRMSQYPACLDGAPMLVPSAGTSLRDGLERWFAEESIRPMIVGEFDDVPLMKTFAQQGRAFVPIRDSIGTEAERIYGLARLGPVPGLRERIYVLTLGKKVRHPDVQRLVASCRRALGSNAGLPEVSAPTGIDPSSARSTPSGNEAK